MAELTVAAPEGAKFVFEEVRKDRGQTSLGHVPILVWEELAAMVECYGDDGVLNIADGTSLRVSFQSIARRMRAAEKSDDEIAQAEIDFRPGKRGPSVSTPVSRAKNAAAKAASALGDNADAITELLGKIASGELSADDIAALISS